MSNEKTPTIWIFCLEKLDSRYTTQWFYNIPKLLNEAIEKNDLNYKVVTVEGVQRTASTTNGAFLDFTETNYYKSSQLMNFIDRFQKGETTVNDKILFTDIWNPCITQVAYIRDLMDQKWELHAVAHAGAYDKSDILGFKMKKPWPWHAERSWFHSCDYNYYATDFHKDMFLSNLGIEPEFYYKAVRSGQPHTPIIEECTKVAQSVRANSIIWPHRYNEDKQPQIAEDIANTIHTVITQKLNLSKSEYYQTLGRMKVMFSCSLHENLGISIMEGVLAGVIPVLPDRCSYSEMYLPEFLYPSEWTINYESYLKHKDELLAFIDEKIQNYEQYSELLQRQRKILIDKYLQPTVMINLLLGIH